MTLDTFWTLVPEVNGQAVLDMLRALPVEDRMKAMGMHRVWPLGGSMARVVMCGGCGKTGEPHASTCTAATRAYYAETVNPREHDE